MATRHRFAAAVVLLAGSLVWPGSGLGQSHNEPGPPQGSAVPNTAAGVPVISALPAVIDIGDNFTVKGSNFSPGSVINFFVATSTGAQNFGPLVPWSILPDTLSIFVPTSVIVSGGTPVVEGEGVVSIQVVDTDRGHAVSNTAYAFLQGNPTAGFPSLATVKGSPLSPTSLDPGIALANVETVVLAGRSIILTGRGFDTANGVGVDLFCACPGGKVGPFLINPGTAGFSATGLTFTVPSGAFGPATGPGSLRVTNLGNFYVSAAVSVPVGARISVSSVTQSGSTITVNGTGFSTLTVINLFNSQSGSVVNLGGLNSDGSSKILLNFVNDTQVTFTLPAGVSGAAYVQALNPPFIPFTSSGNSPGGAFVTN